MFFKEEAETKTNNVLTIDFTGGNFIFHGLKSQDLLALPGICSLQLLGNTAMVGWYDLGNLLFELKKLGHDTAEYTDATVVQKIEEINKHNEFLQLLKTEDVKLDYEEAQKILFKMQRAGAAFLLSHRVGALFDEMGSGKMIQSLFAYSILREKVDNPRCLVIAPKTVKLEWRDAFERFLGLKAWPVEDLQEGDTGEGKEILLVHYEQLISRKTAEGIKFSAVLDNILFQKFSVIVGDEAHFIKNRTAKRTKAFVSLIRRGGREMKPFRVGEMGEGREITSAKDLPYVWFLTGTPMEKAEDIYVLLRSSLSGFAPVMNFLDTFTIFETKHFYKRRIKVPVGIKNEDKLLALINQMSLRRMRSEIVEIDSLVRNVRLRFDERTRNAYASLMRSFENPLAATIRGIQFTNDPHLLGYDLPSLKYEALVDIIKETSKKVVVWTVFRDAVQNIAAMLRQERIGTVTLRGGDDVEKVREEFLRPENQVIVSTVSKGGLGINFMKHASIVIYVEKPFSYTQFVQSHDRVMRIDRDLKEPVLFINLEIEGSTDLILSRVIERKTTLYKILLGGTSGVESSEKEDYGENVDNE